MSDEQEIFEKMCEFEPEIVEYMKVAKAKGATPPKPHMIVDHGVVMPIAGGFPVGGDPANPRLAVIEEILDTGDAIEVFLRETIPASGEKKASYAFYAFTPSTEGTPAILKRWPFSGYLKRRARLSKEALRFFLISEGHMEDKETCEGPGIEPGTICGQRNDADAVFCKRCGMSMEVEEEPEPVPTNGAVPVLVEAPAP